MELILTDKEIGDLATELHKKILVQEEKDRKGKFCRWVKYDEQFVGRWTEIKCCNKTEDRDCEVPFECPHCGRQTITVINQ